MNNDEPKDIPGDFDRHSTGEYGKSGDADDRSVSEVMPSDLGATELKPHPYTVSTMCDRGPSSIQRDVRVGRLASPVRIGPNAVRACR